MAAFKVGLAVACVLFVLAATSQVEAARELKDATANSVVTAGPGGTSSDTRTTTTGTAAAGATGAASNGSRTSASNANGASIGRGSSSGAVGVAKNNPFGSIAFTSTRAAGNAGAGAGASNTSG